MSDAIKAFLEFLVDLFAALSTFLSGIGSKGGAGLGDIINGIGDLGGLVGGGETPDAGE